MTDKTIESIGDYYFFHAHEWEGKWGVRREKDEEIVALCFDKNMAALIAAILNNHAEEYPLHEELKVVKKYIKILCGAIFDLSDLNISREERVIKHCKKK